MASPSGLTSKTKSMDALYVCICVRLMNFVQKKGSAYQEVRERVSRSRDVKENRVRVARIKNSVYIVI